MARAYKSPSIVSGLTIEQIVNMDINKFNALNTSDLRKVVGRLVSAGNKRIRTFERAGEESPALRELRRGGRYLSTKGKNLAEIRAEYARARAFLQSKTSTLKAWKANKAEIIEKLSKHEINITNEQFNDFWTAYNDLKDLSPEVAERELKYKVLKDIENSMNDTALSPEEIANNIHSQLSKIYEEQVALNDDAGVSGFFTIE